MGRMRGQVGNRWRSADAGTLKNGDGRGGNDRRNEYLKDGFLFRIIRKPALVHNFQIYRRTSVSSILDVSLLKVLRVELQLYCLRTDHLPIIFPSSYFHPSRNSAPFSQVFREVPIISSSPPFSFPKYIRVPNWPLFHIIPRGEVEEKEHELTRKRECGN